MSNDGNVLEGSLYGKLVSKDIAIKDAAEAAKALEAKVADDKAKTDKLRALREILIGKAIELGERFQSPADNRPLLEVTAHHATAIASYLTAVTKIDMILKK